MPVLPKNRRELNRAEWERMWYQRRIRPSLQSRLSDVEKGLLEILPFERAFASYSDFDKIFNYRHSFASQTTPVKFACSAASPLGRTGATRYSAREASDLITQRVADGIRNVTHVRASGCIRTATATIGKGDRKIVHGLPRGAPDRYGYRAGTQIHPGGPKETIEATTDSARSTSGSVIQCRQ